MEKQSNHLIKNKIVCIKSAREYLGISISTMTRWIKAGIINPLPGTRHITLAEIERVENWMATPLTPEERKRGRRKPAT